MRAAKTLSASVGIDAGKLLLTLVSLSRLPRDAYRQHTRIEKDYTHKNEKAQSFFPILGKKFNVLLLISRNPAEIFLSN